MNKTISAVIITKEENPRLRDCIKSLAWCDEVIVIVDKDGQFKRDVIPTKRGTSAWRNLKLDPSTSLGMTEMIPLKIFYRKLNNHYSAQRNFGLEKAKSDWVFFVDDDEMVTENLSKEITEKINTKTEDHIYGYRIRRNDFFLGKWLKYGETASVKLLRLGKKGNGIWRGRIHEVWDIEGQTVELENPLLHYSHYSVTEFLGKINIYTDNVAQYWKEQGKQVTFFEIFAFPAGKFFQNYIIKSGFKDGVQGLIMAIMMSFHSFLCRSKLYFLNNKDE